MDLGGIGAEGICENRSSSKSLITSTSLSISFSLISSWAFEFDCGIISDSLLSIPDVDARSERILVDVVNVDVLENWEPIAIVVEAILFLLLCGEVM